MLMATMTRKFSSESFTSLLSWMPSPKPKPRMGPITGEMSIAPIMTGMEFTFRPTDAMMIAQARMKTFGPLNAIFFRMDRLALPWSMSSAMLT